MGHTIKGQRPGTYQPRNTMPTIKERLLPVPPETRMRRRVNLSVNNIGINNLPPTALLAILRANNLANIYHLRPSLAVPNIGAPANRRNISNIVNKARIAYKAAQTNEARKNVYANFKKRHSNALASLKAKYIKNMRELNNLTKNMRLTQALRGAVNVLKKSIREN